MSGTVKLLNVGQCVICVEPSRRAAIANGYFVDHISTSFEALNLHCVPFDMVVKVVAYWHCSYRAD